MGIPIDRIGIEQHFEMLTSAIRRDTGDVVPFLGAGAGLSDRTVEEAWEMPGRKCLPSGDELARHLVHDYGQLVEPDLARSIREKSNGDWEITLDLLKTAQYVNTMNSRCLLEARVAEAIEAVEEPTSVHKLCAFLPGFLGQKGYQNPNLLFVTTNYDRLLERAFDAVGLAYDLVTLVKDARSQARFALVKGHKVSFLNRKEKDPDFFRERPVILKVHGSLAPCRDVADHFVITEDDYVDYIVEFERLMPRSLWNKLERCQFLFLGYSLNDWIIRAVLRRLDAPRQNNTFRRGESWAVQRNPSAFQQRFWHEHSVHVISCSLSEYIPLLRKRLASLDKR